MGKPIAKAKQRRTAIEADEEAIAKLDAAVAKNVIRADKGEKPRNELPTRQVVNIMADEIQAIYTEAGSNLDDVNAQDKALTLWRDATIRGGAVAKEREVPHVMCKKHR